MGSQATAKTELFAQWAQGSMVIADQGKSTGARFWVHAGTGTDGAGYGRSPDSPLATIDYAIGLCTANKNDLIYVMPGHAETIAAATSCVADVAGISIVGMGEGSNRPTLTISTAATATVSITAANVTFENILFVCGTDGIDGAVTTTGNDTAFIDCEFRDATDVEADVWIDASGDRLHVAGCLFNGYTGGNQQEAMIDLDACDNVLIEACRFIGKVITACVNISVASTNLIVKDSVFYRATTTDLSLTVVDTATGSTWAVTNCYDLGAGAGFSGGSGGTLAKDDVGAVNTALAIVDGYHDVPNANAVTNTVMRDVLGNKTDTAVVAAAADKSVVAYVKGAANQTNKIDNITLAVAPVANSLAAFVASGGVALGTQLATSKSLVDALGSNGTAVADSAVSVLGAIGANNANNAFDSGTVAADEDGSVLERLEQIQEAVNKGAGTPVAAAKSLVDAIGFDGSAFVAGGLAMYLPRCVEKTNGSVTAGAGDNLFTITGGPVRAKITGLVTTVIGGASNLKLQLTTTTPAATVELNFGAVAIDNDDPGTIYRNLGATSVFTPSAGLGFVLSDPVTVEETDLILTPGTVLALASGAQGGVIAWYMTYWPLSPLSVVVAAA